MTAAGFFCILKIIALALLGIAALLLLVLLLVLLIPIRYHVRAAYAGKKPFGVIEASWLLHLFSVRVQYRGTLEAAVRVFGIKIFGIPGAEGGSKDRGETPAAKSEGESELSEDIEIPESRQMPESPRTSESVGSSRQVSPSTKKEGAGIPGSPSLKKAGKNWKSLLKLPETIKSRAESLISSVKGKYRMLKDKKAWLMDLLGNEANKRTIKRVLRQALRLLRHILPRRVCGRIRFGFDDPYTTGQILAYASPFYALYAKKLTLIPVFGESVFEGEGEASGRVRVGTAALAVACVFFDRNFRKLMKELLRTARPR